MRTQFALALVAFVVGAAGFPCAEAAIVSVRITGTVTEVVNPSIHFISGDIGDTMIFEYSYDDSHPDANPGSTIIGNYWGSITNARVTIGTNVYAFPYSSIRNIDLRNDSPLGSDQQDSYSARIAAFFPTGYVNPSGYQPSDENSMNFSASVLGTAPTYLLSDALLTPTTIPSNATLLAFALRNTSPTSAQGSWYRASVDLVEVNVVPLPAAAWLLLSGLGGLGFMGRRRKAA